MNTKNKTSARYNLAVWRVHLFDLLPQERHFDTEEKQKAYKKIIKAKEKLIFEAVSRGEL